MFIIVAIRHCASVAFRGQNRSVPGWLLRLSRLERREISWLLLGLASCILLLAFLMLASEVMEGNTLAMDLAKIVRALRRADDPSRPIGPAWMTAVVEDLSALGGPTVTWLVVLAMTGYLVLETKYGTALFVFVTAASGNLVNVVVKDAFARPRPTIVPHLRDAVSSSFPSGHSMESAIVYVTLAAILMRIVERPAAKAYCLGLALLITFLVGVSRVFLGVHYPTDVVGGWIIGLFWASLCWLGAQQHDVHAELRAEARAIGLTRTKSVRHVAESRTGVCGPVANPEGIGGRLAGGSFASAAETAESAWENALRSACTATVRCYAMGRWPWRIVLPELKLETILLVEDEPAVRQLFAQALQRAGYGVYEARNGQEAVKLFDVHGDGIDMLLTDLRMPYMGGAELAHQLRGRRRTLKLLCISGYPGGVDADLAVDFLAKPFSRDDLLKKVREVLDK